MIEKFSKKQREGNHLKAVDLAEVDEHKCLNCGTVFRGSYCPICRQSASTKRLTLKDMFNNFNARFMHLEKGPLHTLIDLLYRPGYMMRDYLSGHRAEYIDPIFLLIILVAVDMIIPESNEVNLKSFPETYSQLLTAYPNSLALLKMEYWIFSDSQRLVLFLCCCLAPAICWTLKILKVKNRINFSEALHLSIYASCMVTFFNLIFDLMVWMVPTIKNYEGDVACIVILYFELLIIAMVKSCCTINWKKMISFFIMMPLLTYLNITLFFLVIVVTLKIELPLDIYKQIDIWSLM